MNVKTSKAKKQVNVENQAINLLSKEELCEYCKDYLITFLFIGTYV